MKHWKQRVVEFVSGFFTSMTLIVVACGPQLVNQKTIAATRQNAAAAAVSPQTEATQSVAGVCSDEFMDDLDLAFDLYNYYFDKSLTESAVQELCGWWTTDLEIMDNFVMKYSDANCTSPNADKMGNTETYTSSIFWNISSGIQSQAENVLHCDDVNAAAASAE